MGYSAAALACDPARSSASRILGCPHRLAWPRTPPFHGGNRGSNPLGDTKIHDTMGRHRRETRTYASTRGDDAGRLYGFCGYV